MRCLAREIATRVLESNHVAAAMASKPAPKAAPQKLSDNLAVLELRNFAKDLTPENARYFTDLVRSAALKAQPQLEVITRENLLVLLQTLRLHDTHEGRLLASTQASGKTIEELDGNAQRAAQELLTAR